MPRIEYGAYGTYGRIWACATYEEWLDQAAGTRDEAAGEGAV